MLKKSAAMGVESLVTSSQYVLTVPNKTEMVAEVAKVEEVLDNNSPDGSP